MMALAVLKFLVTKSLNFCCMESKRDIIQLDLVMKKDWPTRYKNYELFYIKGCR